MFSSFAAAVSGALIVVSFQRVRQAIVDGGAQEAGEDDELPDGDDAHGDAEDEGALVAVGEDGSERDDADANGDRGREQDRRQAVAVGAPPPKENTGDRQRGQKQAEVEDVDGVRQEARVAQRLWWRVRQRGRDLDREPEQVEDDSKRDENAACLSVGVSPKLSFTR